MFNSVCFFVNEFHNLQTVSEGKLFLNIMNVEINLNKD